jgi:hypothetical protein
MQNRSPVMQPGEAADRSDGQGALLERTLHGVFVAAVMLIVMVTGALLTTADVFPGPQVARAYQGGKALYQKLTGYDDVYASDLWNPARRAARGVTVHDPSRAQAGATLYTSGHDAAAWLIGMDGEVLHSWRRPYSTVWRPGAAVERPQPDTHVYFRKAMVYPNGDLLVVYEGVGDTPYGYGVVKLDRNSEVIWSWLGNAHHDIDIGPDGRIYVLTHELVDEPLEGFENLASPRLDDFLVVLSPDGEELRKISLIHPIAASEYRHLLHGVSSYAIADPLHTNTVDLITVEAARNFAFGEAGQVLLSFRELGAIGVLDLEREALVFALQGYWLGQHDPDILANGNLLLFDNVGNFEKAEGRSRVIELDPETMAIAWQYAGTAERPLESRIRADQQRLANGNTLISESNGGRILEVAPDGEIVWEFVNPVRGGERQNRIPIICWAQRLDPDELDSALLTPRPALEGRSGVRAGP